MNQQNIEIGELTNEELKKLMIDINKEQIELVSILSFYYSIFYNISLMNNIKDNNIFKLIKSHDDKTLLKEYYNALTSHIEEIEDMFEKENTVKLLNIRRDLYEYCIVLMSYSGELKYIEEVLNHIIFQRTAKDKYKRFYLTSLDLDTFYVDLKNFLTNNIKELEQLIYIVGTIIRLVPFRLTKEKLIEIVEENLKNSFDGAPKVLIDNEIERIKREFNSTLTKGYGIKFDNYFREVESFKKLDVKNIDIESLEKELNKIREMIIEIESIVKFLKNLGLFINRLIVFNMSKHTINEEDIDKRVLDSWKKYIDLKDEKILDTTIKDIKESIIFQEKRLFEILHFSQKISEEAFNRDDILDEDLTSKLEYTRKVLAYFNDLMFVDDKVLLYDLEDMVEDDYIDESINNFLQYLNRNISNMGNLERKIRMRNLLSKLTVPFRNLDDFINYLKKCLDPRVTSTEEIFSSVDNIYYFMNMFKELQSKKDS